MSTSVDQLTEFVEAHQPLTLITGAGCSVGSGIPTYRDDGGTWLRSEPIQHSEFLNLHNKRQRYWARSFSGWPYVQAARPNAIHQSLAQLEKLGLAKLLVTQNVDRLHQQCGHQRVIDLHGRLDRVHCIDCFNEITREAMQEDLSRLNPHLVAAADQIAPDGDADVPDHQVAKTVVPHCVNCGGILKPSVVFYGGGVDKDVVDTIYTELKDSRGLMVVGSSLMVFSSFRFARYAEQHKIPIAILNPGTTRADELATLKVNEPGEAILGNLIQRLTR